MKECVNYDHDYLRKHFEEPTNPPSQSPKFCKHDREFENDSKPLDEDAQPEEGHGRPTNAIVWDDV